MWHPTSTAGCHSPKQTQVPSFAPFTGAEFLRTPVRAHIYNVRASYFQETEAQVHNSSTCWAQSILPSFTKMIATAEAGLGGVQKALRQRGLDVAATGTYQRNTIEVHAALEAIQKVHPEAVIMIGAYKPSAASSKRESGGHAGTLSECIFRRQSPLGTGTRRDGDGVIVTQCRTLALGCNHTSGGRVPATSAPVHAWRRTWLWFPGRLSGCQNRAPGDAPCRPGLDACVIDEGARQHDEGRLWWCDGQL